jgi:phosphoenolpyruvate carboxykinase (GTP)
MSNMDFLSMSVGRYIQNNLDFAGDISRPKVFGTNYFRKVDGKFLNGKLDKGVWIKWMDLRINGEAGALDAGYGLIPVYEDLKKLFQEVRGEDYTKEQYAQQFTINIPELIAKLDRMEEIYSTKVQDTPETMKAEMKAERERLETLRAAKGDYVSPFDL